ncbi:hypothetical protein [Acinetobacter sp. ANC 4973]|uniref:hypothetical protein n=1 Tax=Acinetobacter sp. ANC 4973 TaxID=1977871 RepID=UPI00148ABD21|nr:hypothetical protein [Acinetobacter sp. ANC 4973]
MLASPFGVMTLHFAGQTVIDASKTTFAVNYSLVIQRKLMQMQQKLHGYAMKAH